MYVTLTCNMCHQHFQVAFGEKEFNVQKCPLCGNTILYSDNERVYSITEKIYTNANRTESISIDSIHLGKSTDTQSVRSTRNIFYNDLKELEKVFDQADPEMQDSLTSIIDTLYLLIYRNAKDGELDKINETRQQIRTLFLEKIESRNADILK